MRSLTTVAECAKLIRKDLKEKFPEIKFSVRSENYAGGNSIRVKYTNGVPEEKVEKELRKYEDGKFDGMTDMYDYHPNPESLPRTKYLFVSRSISEEHREKVKKEIAKEFGIKNIEDEDEWQNIFHSNSNNVIYREIVDRTF